MYRTVFPGCATTTPTPSSVTPYTHSTPCQEVLGGQGSDPVGAAMRRIFEEKMVVGLTENMSETMVLIAKTMGWKPETLL